MKIKKSPALLTLIVLTCMMLASIGPAAAQDGPDPRAAPRKTGFVGLIAGPDSPAEFKAGEVLVKFKSDVSTSAANSARDHYQATRIETLRGVDVEVWKIKEGREAEIVDQLNADPTVDYAELNYRFYAFNTPNDPDFGKQWGLTKVQAPAAWDLSTGNATTVIAIIDSGIDAGHPDLAGKIVAGYDFVDSDGTPNDANGHGTHVAGIAAALTNNAVGVAGMDWQARIMPVRVLDAEGSGWNSDIVQGINWAYQNGAKILNLSLGGTTYTQSMQDAVNAAHAAGSLVVAAMGNCRVYDATTCPVANPTNYPAAYDNVMGVAATGPTDAFASYSQYGSHCDISAPGGDMSSYHDPDGIYSTMPTYAVYLTTHYSYYKNYDYLNGTSQATPFVAGLAALIWALNPGLTPDQVQQIMQESALDLGDPGWDPTYGWGRIDALAALQLLSKPSAPTLNPISNPDGNGDYLVDWTDSPSATGYLLQVDSSSAFTFPTTAYSGPASQFTVVGQGPGTWYYRVLATGSAGNSDWSNIRSVTVKPVAPVLDAISNTAKVDTYTVSWSASVGATSYTLQEDDNSAFSSPRTRYVGSHTAYDVTGQAGGTWYYRVLASNSGGNSGWSNAGSTIVDPLPLEAPILLAISNPEGNDQYPVDWSDVSGASVYTLEQSMDPWFVAPTVVYTDATSQFSVTNQAGGTWYYRVRAAGAAGRGPWSNEESTTVKTSIYLPVMFNSYFVSVGGLPINQGFEAGLMPPPGWSQIVHDTAYPTTTWTIDSFDAHTGNYCASCFFDPDLRAQDEVLLSPEFKASTALLEFYSFGSLYWCRDQHDNCDLNVWLVIGLWDGGTGDDVFVGRADKDWIDTYVWSPSSMDLTPHLTADQPVRVGFQYKGQNGAQIALDDIKITGH
jgi:subtilisin family serine protease